MLVAVEEGVGGPLGSTSQLRDEQDPSAACVACRQPIRTGARICRYCRAPQAVSRARAIGDGFKWLAGALTLVSLLAAVQGLWEVYGQWRERDGALHENLVAADLLRREANYEQAWSMYEAALELVPASLAVRHGQADLAMEWLRATDRAPAFGYAGLAAQTGPVLYRGLIGADGSRRADILSHIALATYLEGLETRRHGEEGSLLAEALAGDPGNLYANTLMGFWEVFDADEKAQAMQGALDRFAIALARAGDRGAGKDHEWVREWQLLALRNALSGSRDLEPADRVALAGHLLRTADAMRTAGLPVPEDRDRRLILDVHGESRRQAEYVEDLLDVLPPDDYLATIGWLTEGYDLERNPQIRYLQARLLEATGETGAAAELYQELAAQPDRRSNLELNVRVDEAVLRITGTETQRARLRAERKYLNDPIPEGADLWAFHAETMLKFDPVWHGRNVQDALDYFDPYGGGGYSARRSDEALDLFRQARDRVKAWLDPRERDWAEHGYQLINDSANAEIARANLRAVWWTLGRLAMASGRWDTAIAELGDLDRRLAGAPGSGDVRYDLACSYSRLAENHADGAVGAVRTEADLGRSLEALTAAIEAWESEESAVDWEHIKSDRDLTALRETAAYRTLARGR